MEIEGRKVVLGMTAGSRIRNLDDESSDVDLKYFVLPTFEDLYAKKVFTDFKVTDEVDIDVQDVRRLENLLFSSNPAYLDLLFARDIETYGHPEMEELVGMRNDIARINLPSLYDATLGVCRRAVNDMEKRTSPKTEAMIDEHGYNTKKFMLALHYLTTLEKFHASGFVDYASAIYYEGAEREYMIKAKRGALGLSFQEAEKLLTDKYQAAEKLKGSYFVELPNKEANKKLQQLLRSLVKKDLGGTP